MVAHFFFIGMNVAFKKSWAYGSTILLTLVWRNVGQFFVNLSIMNLKIQKVEFSKLAQTQINGLLTRGVLSSLTSLFSVWSVSYLDIAEANVIFALKPLVNVVVNRLFYKEAIRRVHLLSISIGLIGVTMVIQPPFIFRTGESMLTGVKLKGTCLRLVAVIWASLSDISLKNIGGKTDTMFVIHYMSIVNSLFFGSALAVLEPSLPRSSNCYIALLLVGLASWFTHFFYSRAYQHGDMNITSIFEYPGIIIAFIADYFIFDRTYNIYCIVGVIIIIISLYICISSKH
jgi:drug/metabolite transporter (DMT)-like permease